MNKVEIEYNDHSASPIALSIIDRREGIPPVTRILITIKIFRNTLTFRLACNIVAIFRLIRLYHIVCQKVIA